MNNDDKLNNAVEKATDLLLELTAEQPISGAFDFDQVFIIGTRRWVDGNLDDWEYGAFCAVMKPNKFMEQANTKQYVQLGMNMQKALANEDGELKSEFEKEIKDWFMSLMK